MWAPEGTANHMLWHAGHALWVQDVLCVVPLSGASELPRGWERHFDMESRPALDPGPWPSREDVMNVLGEQLRRIEALVAGADPAVLGDVTPPRGGGEPGVGWGILHGLHDEAIHQGEMYLLLKMCRAGHAGR